MSDAVGHNTIHKQNCDGDNCAYLGQAVHMRIHDDGVYAQNTCYQRCETIAVKACSLESIIALNLLRNIKRKPPRNDYRIFQK